MRRGIIALLALALVAAAVVVASAQGRTKVTTVSLSGWSSGPDEDNLLKQVVATFEKTHPGIKVDYSTAAISVPPSSAGP